MKRPRTAALFAQLALSCTFALPAFAAEKRAPGEPIFTGAQSCASSSCHGGGAGRNEFLIYNRKDRHVFAAGILGKGTSLKIAEALGIGDPAKAAQCTVCHSPMEAVPAARLAAEMKSNPDRGVSCEACHGAAGEWLRFHTRKDVTYQQILATGLRDMIDIAGRANVCVACHLNLDESIRHAGHPELFFELAGQALAEPPHYVDERPSLGPRSWLTGQAVALREMSWKLGTQRDEPLVARWKALVWLLRKTDAGKKELAEGEDFAAMKTAADRLARDASRTKWTKGQIMSQLKDYVAASPEFGDAKLGKPEHRRRAEVLAPAINRLWAAWKKEGGADSPAFETALDSAFRVAREQEDFDPPKFAAALQELETVLKQIPQS